ncbi:MAG: aromatic amino acid transport family protein [Candidatus Pacearchaeota archaeon]
MKKEKNLFAAIATLTGTIVGAGILGIPYVFAKAGFIPAIIQLVGIAFVMLFVNLCLGEAILRTKEKYQLPGYAKKYLGNFGKILALLSCFVFIYGAITAYVIGEGEILSFVFFGNTNFKIFFALGFFVLMSFLIYFDIKALEKGEIVGLIFITAFLLAIFFFFLPKVSIDNFFLFSEEKILWFFPYGVIMFAFLGFSALPEMREELHKEEKKMKKAIIVGSLIPLIFYFLFALAVYGFAGKNTPQIATIALGKLPCFLAIFTMFSAFFALGIALKEIFIYDLKMKKREAFMLVVFPSFFLAFSILVFQLTTFIRVLNLVGSISGGIMGILALLMARKAKILGNREPEYCVTTNLFITLLLSCLFVFGIVYAVLFNF